MLPLCSQARGAAGRPAASSCGGDLPALVPFTVHEVGRHGRWVLACMLVLPAAEPCTPPSPALRPLRFDTFGVSLDFIHRFHELEVNAVALIHCEDLRGESRGERGWAECGASPDGGDRGDTHVQHGLCCVHW